MDKKYCEAPDKIGEETKERYEKILRSETLQEVFKDYNYFGHEGFEEKLEKPNNSLSKSGSIKEKEKKINDSRSSLQSQSLSINLLPKENIPKESLLQSSNSTSNLKMKVLEKSSSIDSRLGSLKKLAVSSSNSSLTQKYKHHSSNLSIS